MSKFYLLGLCRYLTAIPLLFLDVRPRRQTQPTAIGRRSSFDKALPCTLFNEKAIIEDARLKWVGIFSRFFTETVQAQPRVLRAQRRVLWLQTSRQSAVASNAPPAGSEGVFGITFEEANSSDIRNTLQRTTFLPLTSRKGSAFCTPLLLTRLIVEHSADALGLVVSHPFELCVSN